MRDGEYDDTECKIAAFGPQFIVGIAGTVSRQNDKTVKWNAYSVARDVWEREVKLGTNPVSLTTRVEDGWIEAMTPLYGDPMVVRDARNHMINTPGISNAVFAATDKSGKLDVRVVNIGFDLALFDSTGKVRITHNGMAIPEGPAGCSGYCEIVDEFSTGTTQRSKNFIESLGPIMSKLTASDQHAELASRLVEMSILLHPKRADLGFPIDVLQLKGGGSIKWFRVKPNCEH